MSKKNLPEINKRFLLVMKENNYSGYKFAKEYDNVSESKITHIRSGRNEPSKDLISSLLDKFPDTNYNWLVNGKGNMTTDLYQTEDNQPQVLEEHNLGFSINTVPLINQYDQKNYIQNIDNAKYISQLPKIPFIKDTDYEGDFLCFELKGNSMDNGTRESLIEGDVLLGRNIEQKHWNNLQTDNTKYIIVHNELGVLVKLIINQDINILKLHSLNNYYDDFEVNLKDILKIFSVTEYRRKTR